MLFGVAPTTRSNQAMQLTRPGLCSVQRGYDPFA